MARPRKGVTFWDRVRQHTVRTERGCLEFRGCLDDNGYGRIWRDGKLVRIHREAWEELHGPVPADKQVLHTCDNPACWEGVHLFLGNHAINMADKARKGRVVTYRGERNGASKLTDAQVSQIKALLHNGATCAALGRQFGVSDVMVGLIKRGEKWQHIS